MQKMLTKDGIYCSYLRWIWSSMEKYKNQVGWLRYIYIYIYKKRKKDGISKFIWFIYFSFIIQIIYNTMKEKCPHGVCSGEGEYIIHLTCSYGNDLDMYPATTCDCGRKFNSLRGSRIHKARWCEERNSPAGECKSIDGPMNQVYPHSIHEPIADHQRPGDIFFVSQEFSGPRVIR